jgi:phosphotriesterase-related protein
MSFIRTVLGDISPAQMGLTYSHEHIIIEESFPTLENPLFLLNDVEKVSAELQNFYARDQNASGGELVIRHARVQ